jgi:hypothetical protein
MRALILVIPFAVIVLLIAIYSNRTLRRSEVTVLRRDNANLLLTIDRIQDAAIDFRDQAPALADIIIRETRNPTRSKEIP